MIHATKAALCVLRDGRRLDQQKEPGRAGFEACTGEWSNLTYFGAGSAELLVLGETPHIAVTCPRCAVFVDAALRKGGR
jgi:hypothetical protein